MDAGHARAGVKYTNVLMIEKSLPHGIFVNRDAKRFLNEGENYNDLVIKMYEQDAKDHVSIPAWFIVDATYRSRYNLGPVLPSFVMSDKKLPPEWRPGEGWLHKADTLDEPRRRHRSRSRRAARDRRPLQRVRPHRRRRGLPPRRQRQRPLLLRPARQAEPDAGPDREGAVLRHPGDARATSAPRPAWSPTPAGGCSTTTGTPIPGLYAAGTRRRR